MTQFFNVASCLQLRKAAEHDSIVSMVYSLTSLFPNFEWLREKTAVMFYQRKEFEKANVIFESLFEANPHRRTELRTYAQSLFILKSKRELAMLVERRTLDPGDVDDLCLLGEYYASLQMERHAAQTFERVALLEPGYIDAKELECQSLIELKETTKLLEKLRGIVAEDEMRYSAWNFLGSTHQILEMPFAGIYYYQRATSIKYDFRFTS
ncbi:hypothetical protein BT69DRAFT_619481 [Atractiella rhizophila]|nr:hypothetical protein BT69DRAFT_619481 [Atractiella rhizophila]